MHIKSWVVSSGDGWLNTDANGKIFVKYKVNKFVEFYISYWLIHSIGTHVPYRLESPGQISKKTSIQLPDEYSLQ